MALCYHSHISLQYDYGNHALVKQIHPSDYCPDDHDNGSLSRIAVVQEYWQLQLWPDMPQQVIASSPRCKADNLHPRYIPWGFLNFCHDTRVSWFAMVTTSVGQIGSNIAPPPPPPLNQHPCSHVENACDVNIGSGNGLVPLGHISLHDPMFNQIYVAIWQYQYRSAIYYEQDLSILNTENVHWERDCVWQDPGNCAW